MYSMLSYQVQSRCLFNDVMIVDKRTEFKSAVEEQETETTRATKSIYDEDSEYHRSDTWRNNLCMYISYFQLRVLKGGFFDDVTLKTVSN